MLEVLYSGGFLIISLLVFAAFGYLPFLFPSMGKDPAGNPKRAIRVMIVSGTIAISSFIWLVASLLN